MESKLSGVHSWLLAGLVAVLMVVPSISWSAALSNEELRTAYASTSVAPSSTATRTIQVGPRDTLWSIARTTRPSNSVTIKQAMLAIRDANPKAFISGNINEMEEGMRLVIPSTQAMNSRTPMQAEAEVRRQNQAWVASRAPSAPKAKKPTTKPLQEESVAANPPEPQVKPEPKKPVLDTPSKPVQQDLTLVTAKANAAQEQRISKLENELAASEESLQIAERDKDELAERISDMQRQVSTLQQLIKLKDQQLVDMEKQLASEQTQSTSSLLPQVARPSYNQKSQTLLYAALAASVTLLLILFVVLMSARKKLNAITADADKTKQKTTATNESASFVPTEKPATSEDFDVDLNAQTLESLEGLDDFDSLDLTDDLQDDDLSLDSLSLDSLDSLDDDLTELDEANAPVVKDSTVKKDLSRDALQEAETFIAYGRLEQAAGFLQAAIEEDPDREDLRTKLLEVLVELNDEETFRQQQQQLVANSASAASLARAEELASLFIVPSATPASHSLQKPEEDLSELDLDDLDMGDLDQIFPGEDNSDEDLDWDDKQAPRFEADGVVDDSTDDLADLDSLEADLDDLIATKEPLVASTEELLDDDGFDLEELEGSSLDDLELELDLGLEKPLDDNELAGQGDSSTDFEPVDYKSDADDFMQALDSLNLDEELDSSAKPTNPKQAPGVDEELAALNENFSELEAFTKDKPALTDDLSELDDLNDLEELSELDDLNDLEELSDLDDFDDLEALSDLDDLSELGNLGSLDDLIANDLTTEDKFGGLEDLSDLDDFDSLDDLSNLGDQDLDLSNNGDSLATQLDLATAYIEMGDKEGAREILEKVVKEGDADLKATAQQMLETLAN